MGTQLCQHGSRRATPYSHRSCRSFAASGSNGGVRVREGHQEHDLFWVESVEGVVEKLAEEEVLVGGGHVGQAHVQVVRVRPGQFIITFRCLYYKKFGQMCATTACGLKTRNQLLKLITFDWLKKKKNCRLRWKATRFRFLMMPVAFLWLDLINSYKPICSSD